MASSTFPTPQEQDIALSVGVELEGLFVFQEDLLLPHLIPGHTIDKNLAAGPGPKLDSLAFPGWAIRAWNGKQHIFTYYDTEPLEIARALVDDAMSVGSGSMDMSGSDKGDDEEGTEQTDTTQQRPSGVLMSRIDSGNPDDGDDESDGEEGPKRFTTLSGWVITGDLSIRRWEEQEKRVAGFDPAAWDTSDIELISKVYVCGQGEDGIVRLQEDVRKLARALEAEKSKIRTIEQCGLHVHVGFPDNTRLPIEALRVLMFITLVYEHEMSKFHELHRIEVESEDSHLYPNLSYWEATEAFHERDYKTTTGPAGETVHMRSKYRSIGELRNLVFSTDRDDGDAHKHLKNMLSKRKGHIVNWQNIDGLNIVKARTVRNREVPEHTITRPPTVEFRQHHGTFDATEICHWVRFCITLVQLALQKAKSGEEILPHIETWENIRAGEILEMVELPEETKQYLRKRQGRDEVVGVENPYWEECDEEGWRESAEEEVYDIDYEEADYDAEA